jgi:hypothetical protein
MHTHDLQHSSHHVLCELCTQKNILTFARLQRVPFKDAIVFFGPYPGVFLCTGAGGGSCTGAAAQRRGKHYATRPRTCLRIRTIPRGSYSWGCMHQEHQEHQS